MTKINVKDIIRKNKQLGGSLLNKSNLEFDIEMANKEKNIYRSNAYIVRAMTSGHSFLDANKRTASVVLVKRFGEQGIKLDEKKLSKGLVNITKSNVSNIDKIAGRIKRWKKK